VVSVSLLYCFCPLLCWLRMNRWCMINVPFVYPVKRSLLQDQFCSIVVRTSFVSLNMISL
jgi:hypothetical protein